MNHKRKEVQVSHFTFVKSISDTSILVGGTGRKPLSCSNHLLDLHRYHIHTVVAVVESKLSIRLTTIGSGLNTEAAA